MYFFIYSEIFVNCYLIWNYLYEWYVCCRDDILYNWIILMGYEIVYKLIEFKCFGGNYMYLNIYKLLN